VLLLLLLLLLLLVLPPLADARRVCPLAYRLPAITTTTWTRIDRGARGESERATMRISVPGCVPPDSQVPPCVAPAVSPGDYAKGMRDLDGDNVELEYRSRDRDFRVT